VAEGESENKDARVRFGLGLFLVAIAVVLYLPALDHAWLNYDDDIYITANPDLTRGLSFDGIAWAFSTFHGANWFPLTWLSWMLDFELFGLAPSGFHATNLALHALDTLLLFLALSKLGGSIGRSAFVAAVFAVHPLHVESVAWAAARKDSLSALFFMLALLVYSRSGPRGPSLKQHVFVWVCAAFGLLAKPIVITLPFLLLLLDEWPLGRLRRRDAPQQWDPRRIRHAVVEKLPLFALAAVSGAVTLWAQHAGGAVASLEQVSLDQRLGNAIVAGAAYLGKAIWPADLAVIYPHPGSGLAPMRIALSAAVLLSLSAMAFATARYRPYFLVGWLWYLATLAPVIGLIQVGSQAMADRYMYLPLIGLSIAIAWGVPAFEGRPRWRLASTAAACAMIAALAAVTAVQLRTWRTSETLFSQALRVTENNAIANAYLGRAMLARGRAEDAVVYFSEAVRLKPSFLTAANNLAWLLATSEHQGLRNPYTALKLAQRSEAITKGEDASVLDTLAAAYATSGRFEEAVLTARRALTIARNAGDAPLEAEITGRLDLYLEGRPYRQRPGP